MILGFVPVMMITGIVSVKALAGQAVGYKKALENAGKVCVLGSPGCRLGCLVQEVWLHVLKLCVVSPIHVCALNV